MVWIHMPVLSDALSHYWPIVAAGISVYVRLRLENFAYREMSRALRRNAGLANLVEGVAKSP